MTFREYLLGKPEDFYNFVDSISEKDKIGLVTHVDLDGVASAVFLQKILESKKLNLRFIDFIQYNSNSLKPVIKKDFNILFFTDWNADNFSEDLTELRKKGKVFVIDHHPINSNLKDKFNIIKTQTSYCSAHTIFDLAKSYIKTKNLKWLLYPTLIFDYCVANTEVVDFIKEKYHGFTKESAFDSVPGRLGQKVESGLIYYKQGNIKKVYDLILKKDLKEFSKTHRIISKEIKLWKEKFMKEAEFYPDKKLYFYYGNLNYSITSGITSELSFKNPEFTFIFVSDNPYEKGFVKTSSRNQTGKVDLNLKMKKCIEEFENATAGGHSKAAGGSFLKKDLIKFRENVLKEF